MIRQPAKVLEEEDVSRVLAHIGKQRNIVRNQVMVLLSFKAGLRACEIAGLEWQMILLSNYKVAKSITIVKSIAKNGSGRTIPLNTTLRRQICKLHHEMGEPNTGPIILSERGRRMSTRSVVNWFRITYAELGLEGCSSHSGRRTFITRAARALPRTGGSLRDIQELAGHRALTTTERYIQGDRKIQRQLVDLI